MKKEKVKNPPVFDPNVVSDILNTDDNLLEMAVTLLDPKTPFAIYDVEGKVSSLAIEIEAKETRDSLETELLQRFKKYGVNFRNKSHFKETLQKIVVFVDKSIK